MHLPESLTSVAHIVFDVGFHSRRLRGNSAGPKTVYLCSQDDKRDLLRVKKKEAK